MPRKKKYKIKINNLNSEDYNQLIDIPVFYFRKDNFSFSLIKKSLIKITAVLLIIALNWSGLSAIYQTLAHFNDTETSLENFFQAGILDFELSSGNDFLPSPITSGESASRTISIINFGNEHQYKITATNFSADICNYLQLEANLNEGNTEYSGPLKDFVDFGPTIFQEPADWHFTLTLPANTPEELLGQACEFDFLFFGSQTKNDLPFGTGFNDIEQIYNRISTAVCRDFEIRSMGYWKNHEEVYITYLPQFLGATPTDEIIDTVEKVKEVFNASNNIMRNKLKKQLLAMKFNIAHFGIGRYVHSASTTLTLNEIVAEADNLLRNASSTNEELEEMKNLLEGLNNLEKVRYCYSELSEVKVIIPNGGEIWFVGRTHNIEWSTKNLVCPNDISEVSIWYSKDSGKSWANIATSTENDGIYDWRVPLYLNGYYVPSSHARIKIVARCSENQIIVGWDLSDEDFCPPIDYSLLTDEEKSQVEQLLGKRIITEADIINRDVNNFGNVNNFGKLTTGDDNMVFGREEPVNEEIITYIDDTITNTDNTTTIEEITIKENLIISDNLQEAINDENKIIEGSAFEKAPAIEQQPVIEPENNYKQKNSSTDLTESGKDNRPNGSGDFNENKNKNESEWCL